MYNTRCIIDAALLTGSRKKNEKKKKKKKVGNFVGSFLRWRYMGFYPQAFKKVTAGRTEVYTKSP